MLKAWSQKDKRWSEKQLGRSDATMATHGCFVTSLASLAGMTPGGTLEVLNRNNTFNDKGMLLSDQAAKVLGLKYGGKSTKPPNYECVAETAFYAPKYPQHFFVWSPNGLILDPLDGTAKPNPYKIVFYRLFAPKKVVTAEKPKSPAEAKPAANKAIVAPVIERQMTLWERIVAWIYGIFKQNP